MSEFIELEYKYKADNVKLTDFQRILDKYQTTKKLDISSWDTYYTKSADEFVRFRDSTTPELTIKRKIKSENNWQRIEVDLPLDLKSCTPEKVDNFLELLDYKRNFKIYKSCFVYWLDEVNFVYYIVYDENLKELGRFIEVEVNKSKVTDVLAAVTSLNFYEKALEPIGISYQNRMKKSLFELFVKDLK